MPNRPLDLAGQKFGKLTVIQADGMIGRNIAWLAQCECGNFTRANGTEIKRGGVKSCGCLLKEVGNLNKRHNMYGTPTYVSWIQMRSRCNNPKHDAYDNYGGRGIKVCSRWDIFENFLADVGERPGMNYSIDRIEVDGNYEPGNCKWSTALEQRHNRRDVVQRRRLQRIMNSL